MNKKSVFSLQEIAGWQENNQVALPTVQRGFVWKPSQIENLWDSLLRGYPVGAFVLSPNLKSDKFEILDGQQRATSICLGFGNKTFRGSENKIKVYIDLERPKGEDNRKYIFRVITKSHPWGYRRTDNSKTLTAENIRKAMVLYDIDDYLEADLDGFYPFDASFPIPFDYFINSASDFASIDELIYSIENWKNYETILNRCIKKDIPELSSHDAIKKRISEIYTAVKIMLDFETGQHVPALYLDFTKFRQTLNTDEFYENLEEPEIPENLSEETEENEDSDEIENLFIRLNAGGTPLRGEELNYSILKAHIPSKLQNQIEQASQKLFKPARFITIAYRLFQNQSSDDQRDARTMRIKPKQFQKTVDGKKREFEKFLISLFNDQSYSGKTLLDYIHHLLKYDKHTNPHGLPYLITSKISDEAPEIMFMLLYRIMLSKDQFNLNDRSHKKMIGMLTLFMWFGKGDRLKDHSKLLSYIWEDVKTLPCDAFWGHLTVKSALTDEVLTPFPTYDGKYDRNSLSQLRKFKDGNIIEQFGQKTKYKLFLIKMIYTRDLLLYAQRDFLSSFFNDKQYQLDDTNVPFDWDHISPQKYIVRKWGIKEPIKQWYNTNGNFRAWPYKLNRMDQDDTPSNKLNPLKTNKLNWEAFIEKNKTLIPSEKDLSKVLLNWSFCSQQWANCSSTDMKRDWEGTFNLIIDRNLKICKEWYDKLCIEELNPKNHDVNS
jgi:hypothetical protein